MNIFFLDRDPTQAAKWLHDVHCRSQINESAQLLSGWSTDYDGPLADEKHTSFDQEGYDDTAFNPPGPWVGVQNPNHPCALWLKEGLENVKWLVDHLREIIRQYDLRYKNEDKEKFKNARKIVEELGPWLELFVMRNWTAPKQCFDYKYHVGHSTEDAVIGYRRYYVAEKFGGNTWKSPGQKPEWDEYVPPVVKAPISAKGLSIGKKTQQDEGSEGQPVQKKSAAGLTLKKSVSPATERDPPQETPVVKTGIGSLKIKRK